MSRQFENNTYISIALAATVWLAGCGSGGSLLGTKPAAAPVAETPIAMAISPQTPILAPGKATQLSLTASYKDSPTTDATKAAVWSASNPDVVSIAAGGELSCVATGSGQISGTSAGITATITASCLSGQIVISGTQTSTIVGTTVQLKASANYADGSTRDITSTATWSSSAPLVASLGSSGVQTCLSNGSSQISASSAGDTSATAPIACVVPNLAISPAAISTAIGRPISVTATITGNNGSTTNVNSSVKWASGSSILASIGSSNFVCVAPGSTTLSASDGSINASIPVTCIPPSLHTPSYFQEASEEFAGPFPSWTNVKTAYGAVGDGIADDTQAIQNAINQIGTSQSTQVLWFPAGTYKITSQLTITHKQFFALVGEDPGTTTIKWAGPANGTMLLTDGSTTFQITRLAFDGSGIADTAEFLTQIAPGGFYSTANEISDEHIFGVNQGIKLGVDAETTIERIFFDHLPVNGVSLLTYNTLDIFVTDSLFTGCGTGVTNMGPIYPGAGDFVVTNSFFSHSLVADMSIGATGYFTARHNTSVGSTTFFYSAPSGPNTAVITLQNNTVIDPTNAPVSLGNLGPLMLIDNVFRMRSASIAAVDTVYNETAPKYIFSMGNTYSNPLPPSVYGGPVFIGHVVAYDDLLMSPSDIADVSIPTNVYVPPNMHRKVFEVPSHSTGAAIQAVIDSAVASNLPHAIVHFNPGQYQIYQTLVVPAGSMLQVLGDEATSTMLQFFGPAAALGFNIQSSDVTIKNFYLVSMDQGPGDDVLLSIPDQPGNQLVGDQVELPGYTNVVGINFDGIEHADADLFSLYPVASSTGISVSGGPFRAAKEATVGITNDYSGAMQSVPTGTSFNVFNGGKFMVQDNWHDGGDTGPSNFILSGSGTVTEQTGMVDMSSTSPFVINGFEGNVSLIGLIFTPGDIVLGPGLGKTNLLTLGVDGNMDGGSRPYLPQSTTTVTAYNLLDSSFNTQIPDQAEPPVQWMRTMLAQTRTEYPAQRLPLASDAHRIRLGRLWAVGVGGTAIHVKPVTPITGLYYSFENATEVLARTGATSACVSMGPSSSTNATSGWLLLAAGDGDYNIVGVGGTQVLGITTDSSGNATAAMQDNNGQFDQRWLIRPIGDGRFSVVNRFNGTILTNASSGCAQMGNDATAESAKWSMTAH
jgi:Pectate lyase superfamily protein/Ricin-type beta-trefoil lectin domain-like/Bacterial Ig-like domain (group 2)